MLRRAVRCGNRLNCWKRKPLRRRKPAMRPVSAGEDDAVDFHAAGVERFQTA